MPRAPPGAWRFPATRFIEELKKQGHSEKAQKLEQELPEKVDHALHTDVLEKHGVNPQELFGKIGL